MNRTLKLATLPILIILMILTLATPVFGLTAEPPPAQDQIPQGATINSATFSIYLSFARNVPPGLTVDVNRVTAPWTETEVTWNSFADSYDPIPVGSFVADSVGWRSVDVTTLVQDWTDGTYENYGILLKQEVGWFNSYHSSEYWNAELRPKLEVSYSTDSTTDTITVQRPEAEQDGVADARIKLWEPDTNLGSGEYLSTAPETDTICGQVHSLIEFTTITYEAPADIRMTVSVEPTEVPTPSNIQFIPLYDIPLQDIPLQDIPLQDIPLQDIGLEDSPLQDIPLQDIPLQDISIWDTILEGTPLQDIPLQDITIGDLLLHGIPLQDITLADIFLAALPLQDIMINGIPLQDIVMGGTPLQDIPLQDIPLQDINLAGTPLQDIPLQDIPLQDIGWQLRLRGTPLQDIPLQDITLADLMLGGIPLQDIPLQDIPLQDITLLQSRLIGTPLQDIPLQDITLGDLMLAGIPLQDIFLLDTPLQDIPLQDISWQTILQDTPLQDIPLQDITIRMLLLASTPLQDISLSGTPLQDIPLQDIPLQDISIWNTVLAGTPLQDIPLQDITLGDLMLAGIPLQDIPLQDIPLQDITIGGIPLQDIPLQDIPIVGTPLQDIPLQDISGVDWTSKLADTPLQDIPLQDITLYDLVLNGIPLQDILFGQLPLQDITLLDVLLGRIPLQDITLWHILMALIPLQDIPWESIPLQDIPLQDIFINQNTVTYTITVENYGTAHAQNVAITHTLPEGFQYVAGSTSGATTTDPTIVGQNLNWGYFIVLASSQLILEFEATASISLGTYFSNASATATNGTSSATDTAPVMVGDTFEDNDSWEQAFQIAANCLYISYVSTETDADWYKIPVPPKGSMVKVYLSHLPADYDLSLLAGVNNSPTDIPLQDIPLQDIPLQDIPLQDIPLQDIPLQDIPLQDIPLQDIPLQDIPLQDIPLQDISIERGLTTEITADKVVNETGYYYILVSGYNGAHSDDPYVLRVEITLPPGIQSYTRDLPTAGDPGTPYEPWGQNAETIIVLNQQRLVQYYGLEAIEGTDGLRDKLEALADDNNVKGMILPVDQHGAVRTAYTAWDANAGDPEAANAVAAAIRVELNAVLSSLPNVKYVVVVGSDEVVPFYRVPDEVYLSNESTYASRAHLQPSALYASLRHGYILTDDYYVDIAPVPWMGRELYVPDYSIGRLVENPEEMGTVVDEFLSSGGLLEVESAMVTGYDFLSDGASAIADAITDAGVPAVDVSLINDTWTESLLSALLLSDPSFDLNSINAHCHHYGVGPPVGDPWYTDRALVTQLGGKLIFSMGCHSGLNVDDSISEPDDLAEPGDWTFDLPEFFASQAGWYVGNTGYGYGDTDIVALSEELMSNFARALGADDSVAVGKALVNAKQEYFLNMGSYGPFDEKIMIESTLYGLPMYRVALPQTESSNLESTSETNLVITANRIVNFQSVDQITKEAQLNPITTDDGVFYTADGETQFVPYRPIQPQTSMLINYPGWQAHGVLFSSGTYLDEIDFDPVIARPINGLSLYEPQFINEAWYPSKFETINSLETLAGVMQTLVVTPGQFKTTSSDTHVIGTERLYSSLNYDIYYSNSEDYTPPTVQMVEITIQGTSGNFTAYLGVRAVDAGNGAVSRVVVTWTYANGDTTWQTVDLQYDSGSGLWIGQIPGLSQTDISIILQAVDNAGNVGRSTNKGLLFSPIPVDAGSDQMVNELEVVSFHGTIGQTSGDPTILWNFGDGTSAVGTLTPTHIYTNAGVYTVTLTATDSMGGFGRDRLEVRVVSPEAISATITKHKVTAKWYKWYWWYCKKGLGKVEEKLKFTVDDGSSSQVTLKVILSNAEWSLQKPYVVVWINGDKYKWNVTLIDSSIIVDFGANSITLSAGDKVKVKLKLLNYTPGDHSLTAEIYDGTSMVAGPDVVAFNLGIGKCRFSHQLLKHYIMTIIKYKWHHCYPC